MKDFHSFAIIPAAGRSVRMGGHKLLLPWKGSTVVQHVLSAWKASHVTRIVVIVRPDDGRLAELCQAAGVDLVIPPVPPPEMKDSVQVGLRHVEQSYRPGDSDVWLLSPADLPGLDHVTINRLLDVHRRHPQAISVPLVCGRRGHPVLFPWALSREVNVLENHEGVNKLLSRHPVDEIDCSNPRILEDLDTPDDYERLRTGGPVD